MDQQYPFRSQTISRVPDPVVHANSVNFRKLAVWKGLFLRPESAWKKDIYQDQGNKGSKKRFHSVCGFSRLTDHKEKSHGFLAFFQDKKACNKPQHPHMNEPFITGDGSDTLISLKYGEPYHSRTGAVQESMHVYIAAGLKALSRKMDEVSIFEMGLGTGLNVLLSCAYADGVKVRYTALESEPLSEEIAKELNYPAILRRPALKPVLDQIHTAGWNVWMELVPGFFFRKIKTPLQQYVPDSRFDLVYFDAFAPDSQPELWTDAIFAKLAEAMNPEALLVTYSAKGNVRRAMEAAGLEASRLPGPPGKREMLRARKPA
jgi:tRNA U34 5-methylaminomethyl-2-thiouridine-forming methyltransferase MnmC